MKAIHIFKNGKEGKALPQVLPLNAETKGFYKMVIKEAKKCK